MVPKPPEVFSQKQFVGSFQKTRPKVAMQAETAVDDGRGYTLQMLVAQVLGVFV